MTQRDTHKKERLCKNGRTRAENVAEAQRLRAQGLLLRETASEMGVNRTTLSSWLEDPDGTKQKERRKRYAGTCVDCGKPTDGSNGAGASSERCDACHRKYQQTDEYRIQHTYWTEERIIAAMHWWTAAYGAPPATNDWNPHMARHYLHDEERADRAKKLIADRRVPWFTIAVRHFGSWNAALVAAGYEPRVAHGGGGNQLRRREATSRTHCVHGHEFTPENTRIDVSTGYRVCRTCAARRKREYYHRHPDKVKANQRAYRQRRKERVAA